MVRASHCVKNPKASHPRNYLRKPTWWDKATKEHRLISRNPLEVTLPNPSWTTTTQLQCNKKENNRGSTTVCLALTSQGSNDSIVPITNAMVKSNNKKSPNNKASI
jgi:hypothetical protein